MRKEFSINFNFKSTPCRRLQPESAMASSVIILAFRCVVCSIFPSLSISLCRALCHSFCLFLACSQLSESMRYRDALALSFKPAQLLADSLSIWLDTGHLPVHTRVQRLQITRTWQAWTASCLAFTWCTFKRVRPTCNMNYASSWELCLNCQAKLQGNRYVHFASLKVGNSNGNGNCGGCGIDRGRAMASTVTTVGANRKHVLKKLIDDWRQYKKRRVPHAMAQAGEICTPTGVYSNSTLQKIPYQFNILLQLLMGWMNSFQGH